MMINIITCCLQVFMQMVGRAARQEDEQANVDVFSCPEQLNR